MLSEKNTRLRKLLIVLGHYQTLMIIAELLIVPKVSFNELRKKIAVNPASMDKYLKILIGEELVQKDETSELMRNWYSLTSKGYQLKRVFSILTRIS